MAVAEKAARDTEPGTLGSGLIVVAVGGAAALAPEAHLTAPYQPRCSLDQRMVGQRQMPLATDTQALSPRDKACVPLEVQSGPHCLPGARQGQPTWGVRVRPETVAATHEAWGHCGPAPH